jgi:hypothetical protein
MDISTLQSVLHHIVDGSKDSCKCMIDGNDLRSKSRGTWLDTAKRVQLMKEVPLWHLERHIQTPRSHLKAAAVSRPHS